MKLWSILIEERLVVCPGFFSRFCGALALFAALGSISPAAAQTVTVNAINGLTCAGVRGATGCTAGEFTVAPTLTNPTPITCVAGEVIYLTASLGLSGTNADRYNVGFFTGENGNDPRLLTGSCSVATFPLTPLPWYNQTGDACGDYKAAGVSTNAVTNLKLVCAGDVSGQLMVPYVLGYTQSKTDNTCTGPATVQNGSGAKCNAGTLVVPVSAFTVAGSVTVTKVVIPSGDSPSFGFIKSGTGTLVSPDPSTFNLSHGGSQKLRIGISGTSKTLIITESAATGWEPTATIACNTPTGGDATGFVVTNGANRSITATLDNTNPNAVCTITNRRAVSATNSTVVASPTSVYADGSATSTITVTLRDTAVAGNLVEGKTVTLTAGSGSSTITTVSGITNASGVATFTVKDSVAEGPITYTATDTTDSITITQQPTVTFYKTVTFNSSGGTGSMSNQNASAATALTTNAFTRTGYTFAGWNTVALGGGTSYANGASYPFTADVTLYAQWTTQPNHTVTFNNNGGSGSMTAQVASVATNLTTNTFTRTGYTFSGWNTASNGSGTAYADSVLYSFSADLTLYAQWTALPNHTVTFNGNGNTGGSMSNQVSNVPTNLTTNTFTRTGYTFSGWNTASNGSGTAYADGASYAFTADVTLTAQWTALPNHTVTFNGNGNTGGSMSNQVSNVPTALTLNTFTRTGYTFSGWNTASNGSGTPFADGATYSFSADLTLYAQWPAAAPTATTLAATGVATDSGAPSSYYATLNGVVSSNGANTTVLFEWGLTNLYGGGQYPSATQSPLAASAVNSSVSADLVGLPCNQTIHYRVVATNGIGYANGDDSTFTTSSCTAPPFGPTDCAATRYGTNLGCTAADVRLTSIVLAPGSISSCVSGTPVTLNLDLTVNFSTPDRYDVGIFIANDGKLPTLLLANGGASSCSVDILPITGAPGAAPTGFVAGVVNTGTDTFPNLDGDASSPSDICGDGNSSINGGTGSGVKRMTGVTLPCYASAASGGKLFVPFAVSWDNQKSPIGGLCTSKNYPVPNTTSKCNAPLSSVSIAVVVLPVITITDGISQINPGANTTYTVTIFNNSGGTLLDSIFTSPAVTNLTVNSISCATAAGATCPTSTVAAMQGAGITIPSASLPNYSSLTFTINATLSSGATVGSHLINTATVSVSGHTASATDDDLVVLAPSVAMSFSPATITEGATSVLTITLTNPTGTDITSVSFTDNYPSDVVNSAPASGATTCGGSVTAANNGSSLALSGGTIPANGSCTVTVNVTSATACTAPCYVNSTGTVTTSGSSISAVSATLTVNAATFGAFNACDDRTDPNTLCTNTTTSTNSRISTKIVGTPFTLDLVALKSDGTWNSSYNSSVIVELLDSTDNSGALDANNCRSSWSTVIATLGSNPSFASSNGQITIGTSFNVPNAYRDVRVRVRNNGGTTRVGCSTDNFAIRPYAFALATSANNDTTNGSNPAGATTFVAASSTFTVTVTPVDQVGNPVSGYTGMPKVDISRLFGTSTLGTLATPSPTNPPTFQTTATGTFTYTEVGYLKFDERSIYDDTWTSLDASDCTSDFSNTLVGVKYGCKFGNTSPGGTTNVIWAGRFIPDHFDTAVVLATGVPMPCPTGLTCPALYNGFVYSGQPFSVQVTAKNAGGNPTQNYQGNFAKAVTLSAAASKGGAAITTPSPGGTLSANTFAATAFSAGSNSATLASPVFTFATTPTVPTDVYVRAIETTGGDGVSSLRLTNPTTTSVEGGVKVVSGRISIPNVYGSERLKLPLTATIQYYNGTYWLTSATDSVTSFNTNLSTASGDLVAVVKTGLGSGVTVVSPGAAAVVAGIRTFTLAAPFVSGSVDLSLNAPTYLLTGSNVAGVNPSTSARATFGTYKSPLIYRRENY